MPARAAIEAAPSPDKTVIVSPLPVELEDSVVSSELASVDDSSVVVSAVVSDDDASDDEETTLDDDAP